MLSTLLRRAKNPILRGGHGWDRPDVPLFITYQERRKIDIEEVGIWYYCYTMPEYFINTNEQYLGSITNAFKQQLVEGRYIFAALFGVILIQQFLYQPLVYGLDPDSFQTAPMQYPKRFSNERPHMKKHFLDLNGSAEGGIMPLTTQYRTHAQKMIEFYNENRQKLATINQETKNYIERVELESQQPHKHGHHH